MTERKELTIKEKIFVKALASGHAATIKDAANEAYDTKYPANVATAVMSRPRVQNALAEAIERRFPDIQGQSANVINDILSDDDNNPMVKMKAIELLIKIMGWQAPQKNLNLKADLGKVLDLPTDGGSDENK